MTRSILVSERVPAPDFSRTAKSLLGALVLCDLGVLVCGFVPLASVFCGLVVVLLFLEIALLVRAPFASWSLARLQGGAPFRGLIQGVALLVLLARTSQPADWLILAGAGLLGAHLLRLGGSALAALSERQRKMPILTRGLDLSPVVVPKAPPRFLALHATEVLALPMYLLVASGAGAAAFASYKIILVGVLACLVLVLAGDAWLGFSVARMSRVPKQRFGKAVERALAKTAPEVALYHAGGIETLYQVEMWVSVVEKLSVPSIVILRDRSAFVALGPTRLPVICVDHSTVMMGLSLPALRLVLYPAHAVGNMHMLRRSGVRHAFIGHGDSDKPVTISRLLEAYDEIWVSGPAARDRFSSAGLGLDPERIIEVGRPALAEFPQVAQRVPSSCTASSPKLPSEFPRVAQRVPGEEAAVSPLTVLYAPTWEGYDDEPGQTSVGPMGIELIRQLLAVDGVRVLYRPHPLQGVRDASVRRAHQEILALLGSPPAPAPAPAFVSVRARDALDLASVPATTSRAELLAAHEVWSARELAAHGAHHRGHLDVSAFDLGSCFSASDVLLCDVSSVITDFLGTLRPYGVTNPGDRPPADFASRYPSTRGGYLIGPSGEGLSGLLEAAGGGADPALDERKIWRERLLGPPGDSRFRAAVR